MCRPKTIGKATIAGNEPPNNLEEQIRRRAYELYEARGREDGHDLEDWLQAEAEITGRTATTAARIAIRMVRLSTITKQISQATQAHIACV
jgi:Protein of unknown function (DUF2934)